MAAQHVLRLPVADDPSTTVVVSVKQEGSHALDVSLVGTEGEEPYVGSIKEHNVNKLHTSHWQGSTDEWKQALSHIFLHEPLDDRGRLSLKDVEAVAMVEPKRSLKVVVRKNTGGMTRQLGSVELQWDEEAEIDAIAWTAAAAGEAALFRDSFTQKDAQLQEANATITKLRAQVEDLIEAKQSHEDAMLEKFRLLLNTKKLKIRDQQRLLSHAKVDQSVAEKVQENRAETSTRRKPVASRKGKRKAPEKEPAPELNSESDEEDEPFQQQTERDHEDFADQETPEPSDEEATEDEGDEDENKPPVKPEPRSQTQRRSLRGTQSQQKQAEPATDELPPRRDLPFARGKTMQKIQDQEPSAQSSSNTVMADDDDSDDEL